MGDNNFNSDSFHEGLFHDAVEFIECDQGEVLDQDGYFEDALEYILKEEENFKCEKCGLAFESRAEKEVHERRGHVQRALPPSSSLDLNRDAVHPSCSSYSCENCSKNFQNKRERDVHQRSCYEGKTQKTFSSPSALGSDSSSRNCGEPKNYRCRKCHIHFRGRDALYYHQMATHHVGLGNLRPYPWGEGSDPFRGMENGDEIRRKYESNKATILAPHNDDDLIKRIYNFPIDRDVTDDDIEMQMREIYSQQKNTYKINLMVGVMLERVKEDGETEIRYFRPAANVEVLNLPITVWNLWSLGEAIRTLQEKDINNFVLTFRPNSKYRVLFITQIQYTVYSTEQVLGARVSLPDFIKRKKSIVNRARDSRGREYSENLCFFTALAQFRKKQTGHPSFFNVIPESEELLKEWYDFLCRNECIGEEEYVTFKQSFRGVKKDLFPMLEDCFQTSINVFRLKSDNECEVYFLSTRKFPKTCNLNIFENHLNLIVDFKNYAKKFVCTICHKILKSKQALDRHGSACMWKTRYIFPGGYYKFHTSLFEDLAEVGVYIPDDLRYYEYFAVWDMEAMLEKVPNPGEGKLQYTHLHKAISCSIASNVPGFEEGFCIVNKYPDILVLKMFEKFEEIWEKATALSYEKWGTYLNFLKWKLSEVQQKRNEMRRKGGEGAEEMEEEEEGEEEEEEEEEGEGGGGVHSMQGQKRKQPLSPIECLEKQLEDLLERFERYIQQLIVLSYNGSGYDTNLIRNCLCHYLFSQRKEGKRNYIIHEEETEQGKYEVEIRANIRPMGEPSILKRGRKYLSISNSYFKFLDIMNYLPPATSYANFLKSFGIQEEKFYFPYEFLTSYDLLEQTFLPPYPSEEWYSSLRSKDLLNGEYEEWENKGRRGPRPSTGQENYEMIKRTWEEKGWTNMRDYLVYYNNCDTVPFVSAVKKLREMYEIQGVDVFKETISVPGVARIRMMSQAKEQGVLFSLFDQSNRDLYFMFRSQLVAGPSIIFTRYQEKDITPLRRERDEVCKSIYGYDVNSLYLYCIGGEMPTGDVVRRYAATGFLPQYNTRYSMMYTWLRYMEVQDGVNISSRVTNGKETKVGKYFVDGMALLQDNKMRVYEFNGCYWHKHPCSLNPREQSEEDKKRYRKTLEREEFLRKMGYEVTTIWECEFKRLRRENIILNTQPDTFLSPFTQKKRKGVSEREIIEGVMEGTLVGFLLVDMEVPDDQREYFKDFPPIFVNQTISKEQIGKTFHNVSIHIFIMYPRFRSITYVSLYS